MRHTLEALAELAALTGFILLVLVMAATFPWI